MARLLVHPRNNRADRPPGTVIVAKGDGFPFSDWEQRQYVVIDCPGLPLAQAEATYLTDGIPLALKQAAADAETELRAAEVALDAATKLDPPDPVAVLQATGVRDAARAKADAARAATQGWPWRANRIDYLTIPSVARDRVAAHWTRTQARLADRKALMKQRVRDFLANHPKIGKKKALSVAENARNPREWLEVMAGRWDRATNDPDPLAVDVSPRDLDAISDRIRQHMVEAEHIILDAEYAVLPKPDMVVWTQAELAAATVANA